MFEYNNGTLLITKKSESGKRLPFINKKMAVIATSSPYPRDASYFGVWSDVSGQTYEEIYVLKQKKLLDEFNNQILIMSEPFYLSEMKRVCLAADNGESVTEAEKQEYLAFRRFDIAVSPVFIKGDKENSVSFLAKAEASSEAERKRIFKLALELSYQDEMFYLKDTYDACQKEYEAIYKDVNHALNEGEDQINLVLYLPFNKKVIRPVEISLSQFSLVLFATLNAEENYLIISK